jgi:hypothetical protein
MADQVSDGVPFHFLRKSGGYPAKIGTPAKLVPDFAPRPI